jgi:hypothetical protein
MPVPSRSGPVLGYVREGEVLLEMDGAERPEIVVGEASWESECDVARYQVPNLEAQAPAPSECAPARVPFIAATGCRAIESNEMRMRNASNHCP